MIKLYAAPTEGYTDIEYFAPGATAFGAGVALKLDNTGLVKAATGAKYLSLASSDQFSMEFPELLAVIAIKQDAIYSAPLSVSGATLKVGDIVTLSDNADMVTATTTSGVFQITGFATTQKAAGDIVYGKFVG